MLYRNVVYVNRGWVPRTTTAWKRPTGKVVMDALVSDTEPVSHIFHLN